VKAGGEGGSDVVLKQQPVRGGHPGAQRSPDQCRRPEEAAQREAQEYQAQHPPDHRVLREVILSFWPSVFCFFRILTPASFG
jgi:hypothetical protein